MVKNNSNHNLNKSVSVNNRNTRKESSQETLKIIRDKVYKTKNGNWVDISKQINESIDQCKFYKYDSFETILKSVDEKLKNLQYETQIHVLNQTSLEGCVELIDIFNYPEKSGTKIACLNFASSKNPGGGFLGGSLAQEESLAISSSLYPTLIKFQKEFYDYHMSLKKSYICSDSMIFSPNVVVFKDDNLQLLEKPYQICIITSPAANKSAIKTNNPSELVLIQDVMMQRIDKMLGLLVEHEVEYLVLGAWGCGVFGNSSEEVSSFFAKYLLNDGKYSRAFKYIVFSIKGGGDNFQNFKEKFTPNKQVPVIPQQTTSTTTTQ
ncbi:hypothetical protein DLAC_10548 [Tieghemostelium lacteum]|uniref:Microbial-type PARG catalytic domain-containing protein n=1 Tax=Tieghemostelium lacteum TaxID=361077 RepID=A0A151Z4S5_TIELA|nr:hypothetical protein DLAC_10548 [Tieghemostelium lacteum]|eukprot:KYQ88960.1 hypothetical protein DLAC_10548 [Tieghemostelium lacteum]